MNCAFASDENVNLQLDRFVSGELDERDRQSVIAWLEEDPRRWRLCGLLFLESQSWSQALAEWPCEKPGNTMPVPHSAATPGKLHNRRRQYLQFAMLAASLMLSFVLGIATRNAAHHGHLPGPGEQFAANRLATPPQSSAAPVLAQLAVGSTLHGFPQGAVHIPVVPRHVSAPASNLADPLSDYVRQQWERRGYQVQLERRYVFARLPGGQQVAVPVEHYSLKHVPTQIN